MKTKFTVLFAILVLLFSCKREEELHREFELLSILVEQKYNTINNYMYFSGDGDSLECHPFIPQLKENSTTLSTLVNNDTDYKNELDSFLKVVDKIVSNYSNIKYKEIEKINLMGVSNKELLLFKLKLIEYVTLESIISTYQTRAFNIDVIQVKMYTEKYEVNLGEEFEARLYMTADNFYKPYIAVINGDTLPNEDDGMIAAPTFRYTAKSRGKKSFKGKLYMDNWGKQLVHEFEVHFKVK